MSIELPTTSDVVVIGGGVMGASSAYYLAKAGVESVTLLEREEFFGLGATGRCAGGVRYQFATSINIELSKISLPILANFKEETGQDSGYRPLGYLFVLTKEEDLAQFEANVKLQRSHGVNTQWLSGDEVRNLVPNMRFEDAIGGTLYEKDGLADPNSVVMGYISAGKRNGVQAYSEVEVTGIETQAGRVTGVETNHGRIACRHVLNAAGPWAALLGDMVGVSLPITPLRRQMVTTTPLPELPSNFPFVIDFAQSLYFHREGEGLLTGMSNPDEEPGYDQSIDEEWELQAMEAAIDRMPMLAQAGRMAGWAGLYEVTPDAHPIFGLTPVDGFWIVGGFSGHGFMHGPASGQIMAEFITQGHSSILDVSSLDLKRFEEGRLIHEYNVV